jgi:hypothetical protein
VVQQRAQRQRHRAGQQRGAQAQAPPGPGVLEIAQAPVLHCRHQVQQGAGHQQRQQAPRPGPVQRRPRPRQAQHDEQQQGLGAEVGEVQQHPPPGRGQGLRRQHIGRQQQGQQGQVQAAGGVERLVAPHARHQGQEDGDEQRAGRRGAAQRLPARRRGHQLAHRLGRAQPDLLQPGRGARRRQAQLQAVRPRLQQRGRHADLPALLPDHQAVLAAGRVAGQQLAVQVDLQCGPEAEAQQPGLAHIGRQVEGQFHPQGIGGPTWRRAAHRQARRLAALHRRGRGVKGDARLAQVEHAGVAARAALPLLQGEQREQGQQQGGQQACQRQDRHEMQHRVRLRRADAGIPASAPRCAPLQSPCSA